MRVKLSECIDDALVAVGEGSNGAKKVSGANLHTETSGVDVNSVIVANALSRGGPDAGKRLDESIDDDKLPSGLVILADIVKSQTGMVAKFSNKVSISKRVATSSAPEIPASEHYTLSVETPKGQVVFEVGVSVDPVSGGLFRFDYWDYSSMKLNQWWSHVQAAAAVENEKKHPELLTNPGRAYYPSPY